MTDPQRIPVLDLGPELAEVGPELELAFRRVVASGHFILGPEVDAFEREAAAYLGVKHAIALNSGTDALVIALRALGIGPGDEVIVPGFTFFATAESVSSVGATPVFADIDPLTYGLSAASAEALVNERTRALIPVHLFGHAADMDALGKLARDRGLAVLEDVAQAFGGRWGGKRLGTLGAAAAFSFFPSKNLGCLGDGGLVATADDRVAESARMLRAHGARRKYFNEVVGYNSRLDALQAAFLRAKLGRVDAWNEARRRVAARYQGLLSGAKGIELPREASRAEHVYHQFTIRVPGGRRDLLKKALEADGIDTMVYYPKGLHQLPVYARGDLTLPSTEAASAEVLSLPMWPRLDDRLQLRVVESIRKHAAT